MSRRLLVGVLAAALVGAAVAATRAQTKLSDLVRIWDGAVVATIRSLAGAKALDVAVVDANGNQVTTFGGTGGAVDQGTGGTSPWLVKLDQTSPNNVVAGASAALQQGTAIPAGQETALLTRTARTIAEVSGILSGLDQALVVDTTNADGAVAAVNTSGFNGLLATECEVAPDTWANAWNVNLLNGSTGNVLTTNGRHLIATAGCRRVRVRVASYTSGATQTSYLTAMQLTTPFVFGFVSVGPTVKPGNAWDALGKTTGDTATGSMVGVAALAALTRRPAKNTQSDNTWTRLRADQWDRLYVNPQPFGGVETWLLVRDAAAPAAGADYLNLFNAGGSTVSLYVTDILAVQANSAATGPTDAALGLQVWRTSSAGSGCTALTPVPADTSATALPAQVSASYGCTTDPTASALLGACSHPSDEAADVGEVACFQYRPGVGQPLVLRPGEGLSLVSRGLTPRGAVSLTVRFIAY